jgi:hypothetical protein
VKRFLAEPSSPILAAFVGLAAVLCWLPALGNGFVWDDANTIVIGERLRQWRNVYDVFLHPALWTVHDGSVGAVGTYRPLALASMVFDYKLFGLAPWGFHLTNLLLHAECQILVFLLLWRLTGRKLPSVAAAVLCAVHPSNVESIAWINGRSEPFAALFGLGALLLCASERRLTWLRAVFVAVLLLLSLLGKETGGIYVPLCVLLARWRPLPLSWRETLTVGAAGIVAVLVYAVLRVLALSDAAVPPAGNALWLILMALPPVWFRCLQAAALPLDLSVIMVGSWMKENSFFEYAMYVVLTFVLVGLLVYARARGHKLVAFGFAWWLAALLPASTLALLDWPGLYRWLYVPLPGLVLAVMCLLGSVSWTPMARRWGRGLLGLFVAVFLIQSQRALPVWHSDETLFTQTIIENPRNSYGYIGLGMDRFAEHRSQEAVELLEKGLFLNPLHGDARGHLSLAYADIGKCESAWKTYTQQEDRGRVHPVHFMLALGKCHEGQGQWEAAKNAYETCAKTHQLCREALHSLE